MIPQETILAAKWDIPPMTYDFQKLVLPLMEPDGALMEIHVAVAGEAQWTAVLGLLKSLASSAELTVDGQIRTLPPSVNSLFAEAREANVLLACRIQGLLFHIHFTDPDSIEIEFDPRDIHERNVDVLGRLLCQLGDLLHKKTSLHGEEASGLPILTYDPQTRHFLTGFNAKEE